MPVPRLTCCEYLLRAGRDLEDLAAFLVDEACLDALELEVAGDPGVDQELHQVPYTHHTQREGLTSDTYNLQLVRTANDKFRITLHINAPLYAS